MFVAEKVLLLLVISLAANSLYMVTCNDGTVYKTTTITVFSHERDGVPDQQSFQVFVVQTNINSLRPSDAYMRR